MGGYNFFLGDRDPGNGVRGQRSREVPSFVFCSQRRPLGWPPRRARAMAQNDTVKREMWEGKIPVCFRVADEEVNTFSVTGERTVPEPCYVSAVHARGVRAEVVN